MTYASNLTSGVSTPLDYSVRDRAPRRERTLNVGYLVFAFGVLWVVAIAAAMAVSPKSLLECQVTVLGDTAMCAPNPVPQGPVSDTRAGLDMSKITIPAGLSGSGYDAF